MALTLAAAGTRADPEPRPARAQAELQKRFAAAGRNGNGNSRLTREKAREGRPKVHAHFEIDTAHAGSISRADVAAWGAANRGRSAT